MKIIAAALIVVFTVGCTQPVINTAMFATIPDLHTIPAIDGQFSEREWADAVTFHGNFTISDGSKANGTYPFDLHMGINASGLYIGIWVHKIGKNPFNDAENFVPDFVGFFFAGANGTLSRPSDAFGVNLAADTEWIYNDFNDEYWTGEAWVRQPTYEPPSGFVSPFPTDGRGAAGNRTLEDGIATKGWEMFINRTSNLKDFDGLDLGSPTEFRMLVKFYRQDQIPANVTHEQRAAKAEAHRAYWPVNTPDAETNTTGWLRLRTLS